MRSLWLDDSQALGSDELQGEYDDVVLGAGLTGLVTALLLARAGRRVGVLEARHVGAGTTGNTTAKLSLLQGTKLSRLLRQHTESVADAYVEANREGQAWLLRFCDDHGVDVQHRDAFTYAASEDEVASARRELDAARRLGLDVHWQSDLDVPFPNEGGVVLPGQAQFDPMDVLAALTEQVRTHGGDVVEHARAVSVSRSGRPRVQLGDGRTVRADNLVLATGAPILDRGLYFAKLEPDRSYALAWDHPAPPEGMYLSAGKPSWSIRDHVRPDGTRMLLTGGGGHVVGRTSSEQAQLDQVRAWTTTHFPAAVETHAWSAQDYSSHDELPHVGELPRGGGHIRFATGYDKWGMTNAVAAGLTISEQTLGGHMAWAQTLGRHSTGPRGVAKLAEINGNVGMHLVGGLVRGLSHRLPKTKPAEGTAQLGRDPILPGARSTEDGTTCALVGLCTHLGGTLKWNDAEKTWDCPLHGSRFTPDGEVIEGPATRPLRRHED